MSEQHGRCFAPANNERMKLLTLLAAGLCSSVILAQTTVTVSTSAANASQAYYSLANGVVSTVPLAEWDIAIELTGITGSILANTAKGMRVYKAPYAIADWAAVDTAGLAATWPAQQNSEHNWSSGAFNQGLSGNVFDLGWGTYNPVTHNIPGDSCFVLKLADGTWKKFRMDGFSSTTNAFTFTWSDLDGANEQNGSLQRNGFPGKDFGYYSLVSNAIVDHEPLAADWDLLFTKYLAFVTQPVPSYYPVAGILQNRQVGALQVDGLPPASVTYAGQAFVDSINVIGFDWKNFNMTSFEWEYVTDRTYFVRDRAGNIWKLIFTNYGGSANGDITFTQELVGLATVEAGVVSTPLVLFPNPVNAGTTTLVFNATAGVNTLSVLDLQGKVVFEQRLTGLSGLVRQELELSALSAGMYTVRLQGAGVNSTTRLVID